MGAMLSHVGKSFGQALLAAWNAIPPTLGAPGGWDYSRPTWLRKRHQHSSHGHHQLRGSRDTPTLG